MDMSGGEHSAHTGTSCLVGARAPNAAGTNSDYVDPQGRHLTGHWIIPPGKQVNSSDITWFMNLPFDTTLHYAAVHLHPFAKSLSIRDVTTGEVVFESKATGPSKGVGLAHVDTYSSNSGVPMYKDHKYELISVYDNPTKENHDSMASAFLGLEDKEFVRPTANILAVRSLEMLDSPSVRNAVFRTNVGDFGVILLRDQAPETVKQFLRLARFGVYDRARVSNVQTAASVSFELKPLTDAQREGVYPITPETAVKHAPGVLSMCPNEASFTIVLGPAPGRDGRCTAFARIGPGSDVVREIGEMARNFDGSPQKDVVITKVEIPIDPDEAARLALAPVKPVAALR